MNICAICHEPSTKVVDNIPLCAHCNLTMQSGSRDSLMQTLGVLARLAKANSAETSEALAPMLMKRGPAGCGTCFAFVQSTVTAR